MEEKVELLAPVGSIDALYGAVQNGADAVYLGGKLFNARHYASNFDYDKLEEAVKYAHLNNVKVYVTVNILIDNKEMDKVLDYIRFLYDIDIDAIIVQDLGLASIVRKLFPQLAIHGSTQMTVNNMWGARYLENLGFTRVVLARETPIEEIKHIKENTSIELEAFIHGALCVAYSGQCLMSSLIGGRSGNRGRCAQPCRMPYSIVGENGQLLGDWEGKYILSTKDLNTIDYIDKIIGSGISSLKIEGRMKRPEYVATIVKNYRQALDKSSQSIDNKSRQDMAQVFNREFTKGLGLGDFARTYISSDRPDNRGILLGKVKGLDRYKVYIKLQEDLEKGDGIEFSLSHGGYRGIRSPVKARKGSTIALEKPGHIKEGSLVHRTSSIKLLEEARGSYERNKKTYGIDMEVFIRIGEKPKLKLYYKDHKLRSTIDEKVVKAKKIPLKKERLREQLSKLGNTIYRLEGFKADIEDHAFLPMGAINELRRRATTSLDKILENRNHRDKIDNREFKILKDKYLMQDRQTGAEDTRLHIKVTSLRQFKQLDLDKLDRIYMGFSQGLEESIKLLREKNKEVYIWTEKILYRSDMERLDKLIRAIEGQIDGLAVSNIGTYKFIKDNFDLKIHGDMGLNLFNSYSISHLESMGIETMTLSPELNLEQIREISQGNARLESIAYGYLPAMIMKTCPMALVKGCKDDGECKTCKLAQGYSLRDRMNIDFPMFREAGLTTIYNSVPIMVGDRIDRIMDSGISSLRLDFTWEEENIKEIQALYYDYVHKSITIKELKDFIASFKEDGNVTNGHYFRGVI